MSEQTRFDEVTKRRMLKGVSGALAATSGVTALGSAAADTGGGYVDESVTAETVRAAVREHAGALVARLAADGVVAEGAFAGAGLEPVALATAVEERRGAAAVRTPGAPDSTRWLLLPRSTADADVLLSVDRETGRAFATVSGEDGTTTYVATDDGVATTDATATERCFTVCTPVLCAGPFPVPTGIAFETVEVGGYPVCVPAGTFCGCT